MNPRPTLLFVHGWGFGPGFWRPLIRSLKGWNTQSLDLGFFGPPRLEIQGEGPWVAIGHSTGFLWILRQLQKNPLQSRCLGLVSLMGFSRFVRGDDFLHGVDRRILTRMEGELTRDSNQVLDQFMAMGGVNRPLAGLRAQGDAQALAQGLNWLAAWDERPTLAAWTRPWLALAQRDDGIVSERMTLDCFGSLTPVAAGGLQWFDQGGHFLPLITQPDLYAGRINTFLGRYFS
ncbi:MAG: biotin synthesis protein BioH [Magnetococcales bacterium]|nr:biotin synthesis protein BioH [Magnetococcales bacterium]HIJ84491.1 alpha/beta hydrolase [Magnetococcales bacterium]